MTDSGDEQRRTIDEILAVLQSPARAEELKDEEQIVDAMAAVVIADHDQELSPMPTRSHPLKLALLAGAAVLSVAGVAAAAGVLPDSKAAPPGTSSATVLTAPSATASAVTLPTTSATTVPVVGATDPGAVVQGAAASAAPVSAPPCPPDVKNHGDYVSRVAHDTPPGPDHGKIVSAAAQSDCGQGSTAPSSTPTTAGSTGKGNADHGAAGRGQSHGSGGSNGQGQGHGHGHGG